MNQTVSFCSLSYVDRIIDIAQFISFRCVYRLIVFDIFINTKFNAFIVNFRILYTFLFITQIRVMKNKLLLFMIWSDVPACIQSSNVILANKF